jgi:predicted nucleic-acid-binding protein
MIALDTNVLVRLITRDDEAQALRAKAFVDEYADRDSVLFVSDVVLVELCWTLSRAYGLIRADVLRAVRALADNITIALESPKAVRAALDLSEQGGADFPDCLIVAKAAQAGCETTVTFDRRMGALAGVRVL